jgi:hypothetical protein
MDSAFYPVNAAGARCEKVEAGFSRKSARNQRNQEPVAIPWNRSRLQRSYWAADDFKAAARPFCKTRRRLKLLAANLQGRTGAGDQGNWLVTRGDTRG